MCTYNSIIKFVISTAEALDIMSEKRNLLEKSLNLFTLNKVDRDIYSWNGKNGSLRMPSCATDSPIRANKICIPIPQAKNPRARYNTVLFIYLSNSKSVKIK